MPEQPLLGLILRLAAGFIILAILGYFLFVRLRHPASSPNPSPSESAVAVVTPSPVATATPEPVVTPTPAPVPTQKTTPKNPVVPQPQSGATKTVVIHSNPPVYLLVHPGVTYKITTVYPVDPPR